MVERNPAARDKPQQQQQLPPWLTLSISAGSNSCRQNGDYARMLAGRIPRTRLPQPQKFASRLGSLEGTRLNIAKLEFGTPGVVDGDRRPFQLRPQFSVRD